MRRRTALLLSFMVVTAFLIAGCDKSVQVDGSPDSENANASAMNSAVAETDSDPEEHDMRFSVDDYQSRIRDDRISIEECRQLYG
ncbi:MAG: hypothetical protein LUC41_01120, partial [Clostridiales bacterium]|nr:hypothetical protein [Clostridiales bacterium]